MSEQRAARRRRPPRTTASPERLAARRALVPEITYPEELPVVDRRDDIAAAIRDHQVVVIAGETGSGKTTQLPKICLELGRGIEGTIGHTQPRRIAARAVAERIAEELKVDLGGVVGYQVRFADHSSRDTLVKVMTDGILLAELQRDRELRRYDTIIIDEAHERSLNVDFLLGYLKRLLPRRPDLKVVITSATIDPQRFADHFAAPGRPVPVVEVSGRTFPVEVRYRPLEREDEEPADQITGIVEAVEELWTESPRSMTRDGGSQDILVFLSGEREIRDAAEALTALDLPATEVLPLFGRLSAAEQHRVFARHAGRRIVLSTNVAETSLTVPGIRYVVDTGTARISRYSQRTKVQRLPIEPVSQASANQRSGRCGRLADGIAIRLYAEEDFIGRPEFTDPEILRTNLASVILQMTSLRLGEVARFPFVDPPDSRQVTDGVRLLEELRAVETGADPEGSRRLTAYGKRLAQLPVDPRLGRMLIEADRLGCLREVLVIVSAMSIQDPRERPLDRQELANAAHKRFADEHSDFAAYLNLWRYLQEQQKALSGSAFRRMCKAEFLHYLRIREWQDLHQQLRQACKQAGFDTSRSARHGDPDLDTVHRALLAGLLSHVGSRDEVKREYLGARGARFGISPGSSLFRKQPQFVMAGELVETTRLWARDVARIDPLWAEETGAHLVKRSYSEPRWSARQGSAVATERVTLYGVPLVLARTVGYARVDPVESRHLFIQRALVEGDWTTRHRFFHDNTALVERLSELEARTRRRDLIVGDEALYAFYDKRIPADVVSARHFDSWWKKAGRGDPRLLTFTEDLLLSDRADQVDTTAYPTVWRQGDLDLAVTYRFEPGSPEDGVTVHVPVEVLNQVTAQGFDWQVPGLREDLVTALIRSLPKGIRRLLVPAPEHAGALVRELGERRLGPGDGPLTDVLGRVVRETRGVAVGAGDWDVARVPTHLRVHFAVEDARGRVIARGPDLDALREAAQPELRRQVARAGSSLERTGMRTWDVGTIPEEVTTTSAAGRRVEGYPALVDDGDSVSLRVLPTRAEAVAEHRLGLRRLLLLGVSPPWKAVLARLSNTQKLALAHNPHGSVPALLDDCLGCAVDAIAEQQIHGEVRTAEAFAEALAAVRTHLAARVVQVVGLVEPVLAKHLEATRRLDAMTAPALAGLVADVRAQLRELVRPGFVADAGFDRLRDLDRYLRAALHRLDRAPADLIRDARATDEVLVAEEAYAGLLASLRPARRAAEDVVAIGWMLEELRVSLFAQSLGTAYPVSVKRILRAVEAIDRG
ncbi:MAG TPA: ATP-dependent RNA helicase HrpA [Lapillicoccus sp.]|nr:ATP-dependent RNA helicase HrpA [Lapillicoccus sp.]